MRFIMIVEMTSCAPNRALSSAGTRGPRARPRPSPRRASSGSATTNGVAARQARADDARGEARDRELPLGADVEEARAEREVDREAR